MENGEWRAKGFETRDSAVGESDWDEAIRKKKVSVKHPTNEYFSICRIGSRLWFGHVIVWRSGPRAPCSSPSSVPVAYLRLFLEMGNLKDFLALMDIQIWYNVRCKSIKPWSNRANFLSYLGIPPITQVCKLFFSTAWEIFNKFYTL